jgi:hypothetical protein
MIGIPAGDVGRQVSLVRVNLREEQGMGKSDMRQAVERLTSTPTRKISRWERRDMRSIRLYSDELRFHVFTLSIEARHLHPSIIGTHLRLHGALRQAANWTGNSDLLSVCGWRHTGLSGWEFTDAKGRLFTVERHTLKSVWIWPGLLMLAAFAVPLAAWILGR